MILLAVTGAGRDTVLWHFRTLRNVCVGNTCDPFAGWFVTLINRYLIIKLYYSFFYLKIDFPISSKL